MNWVTWIYVKKKTTCVKFCFWQSEVYECRSEFIVIHSDAMDCNEIMNLCWVNMSSPYRYQHGLQSFEPNTDKTSKMIWAWRSVCSIWWGSLKHSVKMLIYLYPVEKALPKGTVKPPSHQVSLGGFVAKQRRKLHESFLIMFYSLNGCHYFGIRGHVFLFIFASWMSFSIFIIGTNPIFISP